MIGRVLARVTGLIVLTLLINFKVSGTPRLKAGACEVKFTSSNLTSLSPKYRTTFLES
ncbi:hypothetical protein CCP3SC5AM1_60014 [Gammaproteobacteria bacterium]